jgi:2-dehydropantoate 2-reductase
MSEVESGRPLKVLVVGAGAVGQVYARALTRGGAEVTLLVKPNHVEEAQRGFVLYPWNEGRAPVRLDGLRVVTAPEAGHDYVVLTIPTNALLASGFLEGLAAGIGDATVVTLQPGFDAVAAVTRHVGAERVVVGMIGLMAYFAPLPGEDLAQPGVAYWLPPLSGCHVSGPRARAIGQALRRGGLRTRVVGDVARQRAFGGAVLDAFVDGLEAARWDARALEHDRGLRALLTRAARESAALAARTEGVPAPAGLRLFGPGIARLVVALLRRRAPFEVGRFFQVHYTKIATQRRALVADARARARAFGLDTTALEELGRRAGSAAGAAA